MDRDPFAFPPVQDEFERRRLQKEENKNHQPLTRAEFVLHKPQGVSEHAHSLRSGIQEISLHNLETARQLHELVSPELYKEFKALVANIKSETNLGAANGARTFVDITAEPLSTKIDKWIENLIAEIKKKKKKISQHDLDELRGRGGLLFDAIATVVNTSAIEKDIATQIKNQSGDTKKILKDLQTRYPLSEAELKILFDYVFEGNDQKDSTEYNLTVLLKTLGQLWDQYEVGRQKKTLAKVSFGLFVVRLLQSFSPSLFQGVIEDGQFNAAVFLEYVGINAASEVLQIKSEAELARGLREIEKRINERITDSIFFQEFEFMHDRSLGEVYDALTKGKVAVRELLEQSASSLVPTVAGIGLSLGFLTKINPLLGGIGLASLPIMYRTAKKHNQEVANLYETETVEQAKASSQIGAIKHALEEVKTSPDVPQIAETHRAQLEVVDNLEHQRYLGLLETRLRSTLAFNFSTAAAAAVGGVLQKNDLISGGAVFSTILYANQLNAPIQRLIEIYFNRFPRYVQDVERMEKLLGPYEQLDLPEGEKEGVRRGVSELSNTDIQVKNLSYKHILKGVDLEIKQGEYVVIAGASGAGKSTLLRNIVGLYKPDAGEVQIGGVSFDQLKRYGADSVYSIMSYANQRPQIFSDLTVRENLLMWARGAVADAQIESVLKDLRLDKLIPNLDKKAGDHFSGGEMVRIGLARTLLKNPKIMLLDEPTASLDSQAATEVRAVIAGIRAKHPETTIICVTHDDEIIGSGARVVHLGKGK